MREERPDDDLNDDTLDDEAIRKLVARLSRPHRDGGRVIERASLLAAGSDFAAVVAWIEAHGGTPEAQASPRSAGGLHGPRPAARRTPPALRYILPATACAERGAGETRGAGAGLDPA